MDTPTLIEAAVLTAVLRLENEIAARPLPRPSTKTGLACEQRFVAEAGPYWRKVCEALGGGKTAAELKAVQRCRERLVSRGLLQVTADRIPVSNVRLTEAGRRIAEALPAIESEQHNQ